MNKTEKLFEEDTTLKGETCRALDGLHMVRTQRLQAVIMARGLSSTEILNDLSKVNAEIIEQARTIIAAHDLKVTALFTDVILEAT